MKAVALLLLVISSVAVASFQGTQNGAETLVGAWGYGPPQHKTVLIVTDNIFSVATYDVPGKRFINSYGGKWQLQNGKLMQTIEWNSADSTQVGSVRTEELTWKNGTLVLNDKTFTRLDDGTPGALAGAWIITGNFVGDTAAKRKAPFYPRRTMKILSGKHFHWIAYNVATKAFLNASGGTYTTANNNYTETIEFFTKTGESVGKTLPFTYSFVKGDWRHQGQKSTGGAMDECWSKRETLEQ